METLIDKKYEGNAYCEQENASKSGGASCHLLSSYGIHLRAAAAAEASHAASSLTLAAHSDYVAASPMVAEARATVPFSSQVTAIRGARRSEMVQPGIASVWGPREGAIGNFEIALAVGWAVTSLPFPLKRTNYFTRVGVGLFLSSPAR